MSEYLGYAKAWRNVLGTPLWESSYQVTVYFYCLLNASHTYYRGLEPGQFYTSAPAIAREVHQSRNGVRIQLKKLEALGMIRIERRDRGLLITVIDREACFGAASPEGQDVTPTGHDTASAPGQPVTPTGHSLTPSGHGTASAPGHSLTPTGQSVTPIGSLVDPKQEYNKQEKKKEKDKQEQQEPLSYSPLQPETSKGRGEGERFEEFWEAYPKKQARRFALRAWQKLNPDRALCARIMEGLRRWKASAEWQREGGRFVPLPAAWLEGYRWEDEVPESREIPEVRDRGSRQNSPEYGSGSGRQERQNSPGPLYRRAPSVIPAQNYTQRDYSGKDAEAMARFLALYGGDEEDTETGTQRQSPCPAAEASHPTVPAVLSGGGSPPFPAAAAV